MSMEFLAEMKVNTKTVVADVAAAITKAQQEAEKKGITVDVNFNKNLWNEISKELARKKIDIPAKIDTKKFSAEVQEAFSAVERAKKNLQKQGLTENTLRPLLENAYGQYNTNDTENNFKKVKDLYQKYIGAVVNEEGIWDSSKLSRKTREGLDGVFHSFTRGNGFKRVIDSFKNSYLKEIEEAGASLVSILGSKQGNILSEYSKDFSKEETSIDGVKGKVEELTTAIGTTKVNAIKAEVEAMEKAANAEIDDINRIIQKVGELQDLLSQTHSYLNGNTETKTEKSKGTQNKNGSSYSSLQYLNKLDKEKLSGVAEELHKLIEPLNSINKAKNVPVIFNGLKITKTQASNIKELAKHIKTLATNLKNLNEADGVQNVLNQLNSLLDRADALKDLVKALNARKSDKKAIDTATKEIVDNTNNNTENTSNTQAYKLMSNTNKFVAKIDKGRIDEIKNSLMSTAGAFSKAASASSKVSNTPPITHTQINSFTEAQEAAYKYASALGEVNQESIKYNQTTGKISMQVKTHNGEIKKLTFAYKDADKTMSTNIQHLRTEHGGLGKAIDTLRAKVKQLFVYWTANALNPYDIIRYARTAINTIIELDNALIDLKKTSSMTKTQLEDFYFDANEAAKEYGVTTKEIIEQASSWSRLGYGSKEEATELAKLSSQFAMISPEMDTDTAQTGLVSMMKAFDIEAEAAKEGIVSKINIIGNNFATSNRDIVEGMQRTSAAWAAMGESFEDTVAVFTAGQEIIQNPETMGAAMRSFGFRIRGLDEETEELSEDLSTVSGDIADLTKTASNPDGVKLFTDETKQDYRSYVEILGDIADIWDELDEARQTQLLEKMFAKTRAQAGAAIIKNFDQVRAALETMEKSAGNADKEMAIVEESVSYKLNRLKETWVGIFQEIGDRSIIGGAIDMLTGLSEALDKIANFPAIGGGVLLGGLSGILMSMHGAGGFKYNPDTNGYEGWVPGLWSLRKEENRRFADTNSFDDEFLALLDSDQSKYAQMSDDDFKNLVNNYAGLSDGLKDTVEKTNDLTRSSVAVKKAMIEQNHSITLGGKIMKSAKGVIKGFGAALGSILTNMAIGAAINGIISLISYIATAKQRAIDAANEIKEAYKEASKTTNGNLETLEKLEERYTQLSRGIDENGRNINLTASEYEEYQSLVDQIIATSPNVVKAWDAEGRALYDKNQLLREAIDLQKQQQQTDTAEYLSGGEDLVKGMKASNKEALEDIWSNFAKYALGLDSFSDSGNRNLYGNKVYQDDLMFLKSEDEEIREILDPVISAFLEKKIGETKKNYKAKENKGKLNVSAQEVYEAVNTFMKQEDKFYSLLKEKLNYSDEEIEKTRNGLQSLLSPLQTLNNELQDMSNYLVVWASQDNSDTQYTQIQTGYLDELNKALKVLSSDPTMSLVDMQIATRKLITEFVGLQDKIPTQEIADLQEQFANGTINEEDFTAGLKKQISVIEGIKNSIPDKEENEALREFFNIIINGYKELLNLPQTFVPETDVSKIEVLDSKTISYNKTKAEIADINREIAEKEQDYQDKLNDQSLARLKENLDERKDIIDQYTKQLEVIDWGIGLYGDDNLEASAQARFEKADVLKQQAQTVREEFERVSALIPKTGAEAMELANRIQELGEQMRDIVTQQRENIAQAWKDSINSISAPVEEAGEVVESTFDRVNKRLNALANPDSYESKYANMFDAVSFDVLDINDFVTAVDKKRREDAELIALETETQNEINRVISEALKRQAADNEAARQREKTKLLADIEEAKREAEDKINKAYKEFENKTGYTFEAYGKAVDAAKGKTTEFADTVENALERAGNASDGLKEKIKWWYNDSTKIDPNDSKTNTVGVRGSDYEFIENSKAVENYTVEYDEDGKVTNLGTCVDYARHRSDEIIGNKYFYRSLRTSASANYGARSLGENLGIGKESVIPQNLVPGAIIVMSDGSMLDKNGVPYGHAVTVEGYNALTGMLTYSDNISDGIVKAISWDDYEKSHDIVRILTPENIDKANEALHATGTPQGNLKSKHFGIAGENYRDEILIDKATGEATLINSPTVIDTTKTDVVGEKNTASLPRFADGTTDPLSNILKEASMYSAKFEYWFNEELKKLEAMGLSDEDYAKALKELARKGLEDGFKEYGVESNVAFFKQQSELIKSLQDEYMQKVLSGEIVFDIETYSAFEEALKKINDAAINSAKAVDGVVESANNLVVQKFEKLNNVLEQVGERYDYMVNQNEALTSGLEKRFDIQSQLREEQASIMSELEASKSVAEYFDEDLRKALFNDEDYKVLSNTLTDINSQAENLYDNYKRKISNLSIDEWYKAEAITAEYEAQVDALMEQYELAQKDLEVAKKKNELDNIARERNTRVMIGGRWVQTANPEELRRATQEYTQLQRERNNLVTDQKQNDILRNLNAETMGIKESNTYLQQIRDSLSSMTDEEKAALSDKLPTMEVIKAIENSLGGANIGQIVSFFSKDGQMVDFFANLTENILGDRLLLSDIFNSGGGYAQDAINITEAAKAQERILTPLEQWAMHLSKAMHNKKVYIMQPEGIEQYDELQYDKNFAGATKARYQVGAAVQDGEFRELSDVLKTSLTDAGYNALVNSLSSMYGIDSWDRNQLPAIMDIIDKSNAMLSGSVQQMIATMKEGGMGYKYSIQNIVIENPVPDAMTLLNEITDKSTEANNLGFAD